MGLVQLVKTNMDYQGNHHKVMVTLRDIKSGEEITGKYTTYDPTK